MAEAFKGASPEFFGAERTLGDDYLTPNRAEVTVADSDDLLALRDDSGARLIEAFKEQELVISVRFLAFNDTAKLRVIYYHPNEDGILQVAGQSARFTVAATVNTVSLTSPPGNTFLADDVIVRLRGAKFAKIKVEELSLNCRIDIHVGKI